VAEPAGGRSVDLAGKSGSRHDATPAPAVTVTVRYFAAARAAAGTSQETFNLWAEPTIEQLLQAAVDRHGAELAAVLPRCSYLLDAVAVHSTAAVVGAGQTLDVLPPFAGG
jgi:molybdopterin synthase sulfur carrier subunit